MSTIFGLWAKYAQSRPFITIALTEAFISLIGDGIAQNISIYEIDKHFSPSTSGDNDNNNDKSQEPTTIKELNSEQKSYDISRAARFSLYAVLDAPLDVKWHHFLDKHLPFPSASSAQSIKPPISFQSRIMKHMPRLKVVGKRVAVDQLFYEPFAYTLFFVTMTHMEGGNWEDSKAKLRSTFWPTYLTGLMVWPVVQAVNFAFVPLYLRVPFASTVGIFWDTFLSWMNSRTPPQPDSKSSSISDKNGAKDISSTNSPFVAT
ncbi:hypothetical protein H4219_000357 [Mycoemilia scoparia]|uniref:Uncharacterized protein n=1 Tax=Mycoemilia scoparia TaxID=417184 RepID=A0A9W8A8Z4_9FUNG|nr:hypothetical protein H4219_000357 [Mycoemilia scoparia]